MEYREKAVIGIPPWFHVYGCLQLISRPTLGNAAIFMARFEEKAFLSTIQKYRVHAAMLAPPTMVFLAKHPMVDKYDLSSLKILYCGAAPLGREVEDQIKQRYFSKF